MKAYCFIHLNVHSHYSINDGCASIRELVDAAIKDRMLIKHKKTKKGIRYLIPCMEKYLHNTYGFIVYQEQLMMLSRLIADFTRAESDLLRKALGMRKTDVLSIMKSKFIEGGMKNDYKKNALEKVWNEMERIGIYPLKSHVVCYTWLAYQMAYLKAHYPIEFKSTLYHNIKDYSDDE